MNIWPHIFYNFSRISWKQSSRNLRNHMRNVQLSMVIDWVFCQTFFPINLCFKNCNRASVKLLNNMTEWINLKIKLINLIIKNLKKCIEQQL